MLFNDAGSRIASIDTESAEGHNKFIPTEYQLSFYHQPNVCYWLSVYLLIESLSIHLVEYVLRKYKMNCKAYEWLRVHVKGANGRPKSKHLFEKIKHLLS